MISTFLAGGMKVSKDAPAFPERAGAEETGRISSACSVGQFVYMMWESVCDCVCVCFWRHVCVCGDKQMGESSLCYN